MAMRYAAAALRAMADEVEETQAQTGRAKSTLPPHTAAPRGRRRHRELEEDGTQPAEDGPRQKPRRDTAAEDWRRATTPPPTRRPPRDDDVPLLATSSKAMGAPPIWEHKEETLQEVVPETVEEETK